MSEHRQAESEAGAEDRCLITGASGFIGGRLTERLLSEGRAVRCLVRASSDTSRLRKLGVEIVLGDLSRPPTLASAVEGCSHVFHCAALVSDWATTAEIAAANVHGARNMLTAAAAASVKRFIHISSTDVYGHPGTTGVDETHTPTRFANWYAQTKLEGERQVRLAASAHSLDLVILRPATVYGPGSKEVVGEISRAIEARHMLLIDHGRPIAGLCYIENLIDAALLARHSPRASGQALNISDGLPVTWREFVDGLADGLGAPRPRWSIPYGLAAAIGFALEHGYRLARRTTGLSLPPLLSRQAVQVLGIDQDFSNEAARELLCWEPRVDYQAGLQATLEWLTSEYLKHA